MLDLLLSERDGSDICKGLKNDQKLNSIPIVMMSAHPGANSKSLNAGANDFISKPFEINQLLEIMFLLFDRKIAMKIKILDKG